MLQRLLRVTALTKLLGSNAGFMVDGSWGASRGSLALGWAGDPAEGAKGVARELVVRNGGLEGGRLRKSKTARVFLLA